MAVAMKALYIFFGLIVFLSANSHADSNYSYEDRLISALDLFLSQDYIASESKLKKLINEYPNSRAASLLYGDILATRGGLIPILPQTIEHLGKDQVSGLRDEILSRWTYSKVVSKARTQLIPEPLINLRSEQRWVLYMDIPLNRLFLFEHQNTKLEEKASFYASIGLNGYHKRYEGDQKTPIGVYYITDYIAGNKLHERYGPGALTLDYPNTVDRFHRRTGSGIWIHGTEPDFLSRPPKASDGCLTLDNNDFKIISNLVKGSVSVPVIIDHSPRWVSETERLKQKSALWKSFSDWFATEAALNFPNLTSVLTQNNGSVKLDSKQIDAFEIFHNLNVIPELTKTQILKYPGETNTYITEMSLKPEASDSFTIRQFWRYNDLNQWSLINLFDQ
tara:strand:- start:28842 stop:30017 length:1176 start_codon:yes stop_codon:yes gene_type:complete